MKTIIAAGILLASGSAALAGPYVNVESNSGRYGNSYLGTVIESHIGYEGVIGETGADWYVQSGPAFSLPNGDDAQTDFSGKAGIVYDIADDVEIYKEIYFITGDETATNFKVGATYRF
jgi:hypothetical protein|tara:strand:+ start:1534 stop:1890 length:357 start_codon:yes stop_codon:yes gene_type:complete